MTTEAAMALKGELRSRSALNKKLDKGKLADTQAGVALTKRVIAKYMDSVATWIDEALDGKAGRYPIAAKILKDLPLEPVCYIAVKGILDAAVQSKAFHAACRFVTRRIELELLNESLSKSSDRYENYLKHARETAIGLERQAYSVIRSAAYFEGTPTKMFADNERLILGAFLIDHFIETTGVVQYSIYKSSANKTKTNLIFDPKIEDWYKNGGGIVAMHAALVRQTEWPWFNELAGCDFNSDSEYLEARIIVIYRDQRVTTFRR